MKMKKIVPTVALSALCICQSPSPVNAYAFVCTNCSTNLQQALEYAAQLKELAELVTQTKEAIKQTEMQIKNLERIPENLKDNPLNWLTSLAEKTAQLNTYRADENLLAQIFNELYPEQSEFASLAQPARKATEILLESAFFSCCFAFKTLCFIPLFLRSPLISSDFSIEMVPTKTGCPFS